MQCDLLDRDLIPLLLSVSCGLDDFKDLPLDIYAKTLILCMQCEQQRDKRSVSRPMHSMFPSIMVANSCDSYTVLSYDGKLYFDKIALVVSH